jgi:hypothetical protein
MSYRDSRPLIAIAILVFVAVAAKPVMGQILKPRAAHGGFAGLEVTSEIRAASRPATRRGSSRRSRTPAPRRSG